MTPTLTITYDLTLGAFVFRGADGTKIDKPGHQLDPTAFHRGVDMPGALFNALWWLQQVTQQCAHEPERAGEALPKDQLVEMAKRLAEGKPVAKFNERGKVVLSLDDLGL